MIDWQPWATVPKEEVGPHILVWDGDLGGPRLMSYDSELQHWWEGDYQFDDEGFTHWASIQAPPSAGS